MSSSRALPLRVLHVIGGSEFGGIVPYVASLVRMAREHGGEASVLATAPRIVDYYRQRGIEVVPIEGIDRPVNPLRDLAGLTRLVRYLKRENFTLVHTHTSKGGIIGRLAAKMAGIPVVVHTTQGYAFNDYAGNALSRALFLVAERAATGWCDAVIAANDADRTEAVGRGIVKADKIVTIPNGLDLAEADRQLACAPDGIRAELGLNPGGPIVGAMARLARQKGLDVLIDAIPQIAATVPDVEFLIVGSGELEAELKARAITTGFAERIHFQGFRDDWYRVLRGLDVFVMPSRWEGLPITLLGAMAAELPIVATRIKGIADVCSGADVAVLVEPDHVPSLAQQIVVLLQNREKATMLGRAARAHLVARYSDLAMNEQTWRIYSAAAGAKGISFQA
ncbi:MAG: glycosyltransferase family 4 protein [Acidobacteriota bacterium]